MNRSDAHGYENNDLTENTSRDSNRGEPNSGRLRTYTYLSSKADLLNDAHQTMDEAVSRLSITLVSPLWDINKDSAQEFVAAEMTSNAVMRIVVHDTKNVLFTGKTRDASGEMVDQVVSV